MKKVGIFHSIPTKAELQKNYLIFDELQTSLDFIRSTNNIIKTSPYKKERYSSNYSIEELEPLFREKIIQPKEDIEKRILPDTGSFDAKRIESELLKAKNISKSKKEESLLKYFSHLSEIRKKFKVEIYGERRPLFGGLLGNFLLSNFNSTNFYDDEVRYLLREGGIVKYMDRVSNSYSRSAAALLNSYYEDISYYPIISNLSDCFSMVEPDKIKQSNVYNLVIKQFPIPDSNVTWQKLIEFKNDSDSNLELLKLRKWISDISNSPKSLSDINDELQYLMLQYEKRLKYHKIKYSFSGLQTIILPTLEVIENLVKIKFKDAANVLFNLSTQRIRMLEEENKLEGREVAYISSIRKKFGK